MKVLLLALLVAAASALPRMHREVGRDSKIVGGVVADDYEFPWQCHMSITKGTSSYFCGCSVINETWVVTAAHCTIDSTQIVVTAGDIDRSDTTGNEQARTATASEDNFNQIFTHPDYRPAFLKADIAMVKISPVFDLTTGYVEAIDLPTLGVDAILVEGDAVYTSGWGKDSDGAILLPGKLLKTNMTISNQQACDDFYKIVGNGTFCTQYSQDGTYHGVCSGDSGGPVVKYGERKLRGVVSFVSSNGCESGDPDGFTRLIAFIDWILSIISDYP